MALNVEKHLTVMVNNKAVKWFQQSEEITAALFSSL